MPNSDPRVTDSEKQQLAYASAVIASLRLERDFERCAHNRMRQEAHRRIADLEAQVTSRERELASYQSWIAPEMHSRGMGALGSHFQPTARKRSDPQNGTTSRDPARTQKAVAELLSASTKSRISGLEIENLSKRVRNLTVILPVVSKFAYLNSRVGLALGLMYLLSLMNFATQKTIHCMTPKWAPHH